MSTANANIPSITANGVELPRLSFGTHNMKGKECKNLVRHALESGIRFLDTASYYDNEEEVGQAVRESGIPREDIIVGTKVWRTDVTRDKIIESVNASLERLGLDYVDVIYPHWHKASTTTEDMMAAFQYLLEQGKVKSVAMSNFNIGMMEEVMASGVQPVIGNQIEYHPYLGQKELYDTMTKRADFREYDLAVIAYSPLANGRAAGDPVLMEIGEKYDKTAAQVALRWVIERGQTVAMFRGDTPEQINENIDIFDFSLSPDDMHRIDALNARNLRLYEHPSMRKKWDKARVFEGLNEPQPHPSQDRTT